MNRAGELRTPSFGEALRFWLKLGFISFGGPAGQIAIMQRELVEQKRWISQSRFLHALNFCMLLPGPEAQQLAIYCGWLLHRTRGGIVAGVLFVLPSMFILWALSYVYVSFGMLPWLSAVFYGLKPAVVAIVIAALIRIGARALQRWPSWVLALLAFVSLYVLNLPFPLVLLSAAALGMVFPRLFPHDAGDEAATTQLDAGSSISRTIRITAVCLALWFGPIVAGAVFLGPEHTLVREGVFFSKAAVVTFGGAYAVLPYVAQQAVETHHWLSAPQMLDGLGLAETTPGPLIMVLQFVGFLGGWNQPMGLPPLVAATLGAAMTTWVTFVPCFLWILIGAPHVEKLRGSRRLSAALSSITAAVVGVILNLAVWFGGHVFFPTDGGVDLFAMIVAATALLTLTVFRWNVVAVIALGGVLGAAYQLLI